MNRCMLLLATLGAAALLCAAVGIASARSFSSSTQTMRATWQEFEITDASGTTSAICPLTLEGSFHARTYAKVAGTLIGYINRAGLSATCPFEFRLLSETLPWHVRYRSFSGVLPTIATIAQSVVGFAIRLREPFGTTCLGTSTATEPLILTYARGISGVLTEVTPSGSVTTVCTPFPNSRLSFSGTSRRVATTTITLI